MLPLVGPVPPPPSYEAAAAAVDAYLNDPSSQSLLDDSFQCWAVAAEAEVLGSLDLADDDAYWNRVRAPEFKWVNALHHCKASPEGGAPAATWHSVADRLRELLHLTVVS